MFSYLKFLSKSTNAHGVHSPFVYNYITQGLYAKPRLSRNKIEDVLLKSISYFGYENIRIDDDSLRAKLETHLIKLPNNTSPLDAIVLKDFKFETVLELIVAKKIHNDSLVLIQDLQGSQVEWEKTIAHPKITVSLDSFSVGILFIRHEQVKQHFIIRI